MGNQINIEKGRNVKVVGCELSREYVGVSLQKYKGRIGTSLGTVQILQSNNTTKPIYATRVLFKDNNEIETFISSDLQVV